MRVCFISHSSGMGGAERALLELIDALRSKGVEAYVILPSYGPLTEELGKRRIPFYLISYYWWMHKNLAMWKRLAISILNLIKVIPIAIRILLWKCDVIYTNTITIFVGALAAKLLRLPHIWHIHEFGYEDHGLIFDFGTKFSLWFMDKFSSVCIVNSNAVMEKYKQFIPKQKLKMVYYAVRITDRPPYKLIDIHGENNKKVSIRCVIVGQLHEGKRQEDAIKAINELIREGMAAELYIIGDGDPKYREYLRNLVVKNKLEKYVKFIGYVDNPFPFVKRADVALMCSRYEAFGRVTVEAMKLGKPVIGARSGGTVELIREGFNGLLYTPGNYKELAEKIKYLYEHPDIARQMGENGQRWATERFNQERYAKEILTILKAIIIESRGVNNED